MTKEEALTQLRIGPGINEDVSEEYNDAVNMAIEALEQEPCEDAVSRKEVFETFGELLGVWGRKALMELPPASPTCKEWIPVSERLPEEEGDYLLWGKVCEDEEEYQFIGSYDSGCEQFGVWEEQFDRTTLGCLGSEFFEYASVIAWMPLPKSYDDRK